MSIESKAAKLNEDAAKLESKIEELMKLVKTKKSQAKAAERKERTHRLILHGGLVEMVLGNSFDKGLLVGLLSKYRDVFSLEQSDNYIDLKREGDRLIAEAELRNKAKRKADSISKDEENGGV